MKPRLCISVVLIVAAGCVQQFDPPPGYIRDSGDRRYDQKVVSSKGHVIALKRRANEERGATLAFWADAIEHQKVELDNMRLVNRESIKSAAAREGVLFTFEIGEGQDKITYLIALYVTPSDIITIEATGPATEIEKDLPAIRTSVQSLRS